MKTKTARSFLATILVLCMISSMCVTAVATDIGDEQQRYTGLLSCYAGLAISNWGRATCSGYAECNPGYSATLTMELKRGSTTIKTWTTSGSGMVSLDKTYYVVSGYTYQVVITMEVKDSHGVVVDTIEKSSYSVTF